MISDKKAELNLNLMSLQKVKKVVSASRKNLTE